MKKIIYIALCLIGFSGCDNWLDVSASDQIKESQLFENGNGFRSALLGIYQNLSTEDLYGKNMTWGFMDCLGQLYDPKAITLNGGELVQAQNYAFEHSAVKPVITKIWESMYNCIANCNNVITNIEHASPSIFEYKEEEKNMILGEALALRGFMHFDLLRLFAPAPKAGASGTYIPYCTSYPEIRSPKLSVDDFLKLVIEDLEKAQDLTAKFDTLPDNIKAIQDAFYRVGKANYFQERGIFWSYRGTRMNYMNVTALLARVYMYSGQIDKAYEEAKYLLDFEGLEYPSYSSSYDGNSKSREDIILAFFNKNVTEIFKPWTGENGYLKIRNVEDLFEGETTDRRYSKMTTEIAKGTRISAKYVGYEDPSKERDNGPLIPVIRKAEMYYIACEYFLQHKKVDEAKALLAELREERGNGKPLPELSESQFIETMLLDARRELMSEGQLFFLYKYYNLPIWDGNTNPSITAKFVLPVPASENI